MEAYSIADVEKLTGIKAHTLRIWEKRYKSLIPHRTPTHIRYYDDDQLRRLLNVTTLLDLGHKISRIMTYTEQQVNEFILDAGERLAAEPHFESHVHGLTQSMIDFDETGFEKVISGAFARFGVITTVLKIIYPFLRRTGLLWSTHNVAPAQEHFACSLVRRKLCSALNDLPVPNLYEKKAVLFLPPDEWHEIGLVFADYLLRNAGIQTFYLGQNVPYASVEMAIEKIQPDFLVTMMVAGQSHFSPFTPLVKMAVAHSGVTLFYASIKQADMVDIPGNILYLEEPLRILEKMK